MSESSTARRKSGRARRPPPDFNSSPSPPPKASTRETAAAKRARVSESTAAATPKVGLPSQTDPTAFVKAAQRADGSHSLPFYPTIELDTGVKVLKAPDWLRRQAPADAAEGKEYIGRLMGKVTLKIQCAPAVTARLVAAHKVNFVKMNAAKARTVMKTWDVDGEFKSANGEHVPVSRLLDAVNAESNIRSCSVVKPAAAAAAAATAACAVPTDARGERKGKGVVRDGAAGLPPPGGGGAPSSAEAADLLQHLYALQSPQSSPWKRPMLRALSTHTPDMDGFTVTYYIYTSRLLFELIADPAISGMMKSLEPVAKVTPPAVLEKQPAQFISSWPSFRSASSPPSPQPPSTPAPPSAAAASTATPSSDAPGRGGSSSSSGGGGGGGGGSDDRPGGGGTSTAGGRAQGRGKGRGPRGGMGDANGSGPETSRPYHGSQDGSQANDITEIDVSGSVDGGSSPVADGAGGGQDANDLGVLANVAARRAYDFSLAGILKSAESSGYRIVDDQPKELTVELFQYQRSSCQWMLDHERDVRGLNGYFWERREWADGGDPLWYFPLAGEFRLAEPPHITGGLLCEEMGLGKTVEVVSTILANPRDGGLHSSRQHRMSLRAERGFHRDDQMRVVSRATLIVVPVSLVGQWTEEIRKNCTPGALRVMTLAGSMEQEVYLSELLLSGVTQYPRMGPVRHRVVCEAPFYAQGESAANCSFPWIRKGTVYLTEEQIRWIERRPRQGRRNSSDVNGALAPGARLGVENGASRPSNGGGHDVGDVKVRVEFKLDPWLVADNDVVLTTYEFLRIKSSFFRKINFHRCVLDECQEIKTATTNIARMCQQVKASHRWMVSGTPIAGTIDSLHGELNFLQVWPFSLQNDGFWEKKVSEPFAAKDDDALELLRALTGVVMMRHSKSQTYLDGRPLVKIPARTVEWRGVDFSTLSESGQYSNRSAPHARYVYKYLENLCASVCRKMEDSAGRRPGGAGGGGGGAGAQRGGRGAATGGDAEGGMGRREFQKLRSLLALMQQASTHPELVNLGQLDTLKRSIQTVAPVPVHMPFWQGVEAGGAQAQANVLAEIQSRANAIETLPAEEVLRRLAQKGSGNMGGLNRDVNRNWAVGGEAEMKLRDSLEAMPLSDLQRRLEEEGLPVPRSWAVLKPKADIDTGSVNLRFGGSPPSLLPPPPPPPPAPSKAEASTAAGGCPGEDIEVCDGGVPDKKSGGVGGSGSGSGDGDGDSKGKGKGKGKGKRKRDESVPSGGAAASYSSSSSPSQERKFDVRKLLKVSDTIRIGVNEEDNEATVEAVEENSATLVTTWVPGPVKGGSVYRFSVSSRRKPYVDMLVASQKAKKETEVQVAGFSAIYKAMAGEPVPCPICMCNVVRPTVTKCAHLFCRECISRELQKTPAMGMLQAPQAKCPICRRTMKGEEMMEMKTFSEVEDATVIDVTSGSGSGNGSDEGEGKGAGAGGGDACGDGGSACEGKGRGKGKDKRKVKQETIEIEDEGGDAEGGTNRREGSSAAAAAAAAAAAGSEHRATAETAAAAAAGSAGASTVGAAHASDGQAAGNGATASPHGSSAASSAGGGEAAAGALPSSPSTSTSAAASANGAARVAAAAAAVGPSGARSGGATASGEVEDEAAAGPTLVIPSFRFTPTATTAQLNDTPATPYMLPRDNTVPSLDRTFLSQYRAATSSTSSVKLDALVRDMEATLQVDPASKFVIFSQYPQVVNRAGAVLRTRGVRSTSIVGGRTRVERSSAVSSFTNDPSIRAILLTTGSAAAGLTLTAAQTVYMLDPVWSAADEAQALNRAHRIGQAHTVRCVVFYMKDSVEERLLALRQSKGNFAQFLESADSVVSLAPEGVDGSFMNMFALPELKKLFGMVGAEAPPAPASGAGGGGAAGTAGAGTVGGGGALSHSMYSHLPINVEDDDDDDDDDEDDDDDDDDEDSYRGVSVPIQAWRALGITQEELDMARAIALSRSMIWQASSGGSSGAAGGSGAGASGSPFGR